MEDHYIINITRKIDNIKKAAKKRPSNYSTENIPNQRMKYTSIVISSLLYSV